MCVPFTIGSIACCLDISTKIIVNKDSSFLNGTTKQNEFIAIFQPETFQMIMTETNKQERKRKETRKYSQSSAQTNSSNKSNAEMVRIYVYQLNCKQWTFFSGIWLRSVSEHQITVCLTKATINSVEWDYISNNCNFIYVFVSQTTKKKTIH